MPFLDRSTGGLLRDDKSRSIQSFRYGVHLTCLLATAVAGLVAFVCLLQPRLDGRDLISQQDQQLDQMLAKAAQTQRKHAQLRKSLGEVKHRQSKLLQQIPDMPREAKYLAFVTKTANGVGLSINNYHPGRLTTGRELSEMELQLSAVGSFQAICRFVDGIENAPRIAGVERLSVSSAPAPKGHAIEMTLVLYFRANSQPDPGKKHG